MKRTKTKLGISLVTLMITVFMLLGSTYAWFTDSVSNTGNRIQAGTLDIDLLMYNGEKYSSIAGGTGDIFDEATIAQNSNDSLWEPGKTQIVYLAVKNEGNLDAKYNIYVDVTDEGLVGSLEYAIIDKIQATDSTYGYDKLSTLNWDTIEAKAQIGYLVAGRTKAAEKGSLAKNSTDYFVLAVHMDENAGNKYQDKDVIIDVNIVATQQASELDGFNSNEYDKEATYPALAPYINSTSGAVVSTSGKELTIKDNDTGIESTIKASTSGIQIKHSTSTEDNDEPKDNYEMTENSNLSFKVTTTEATENSVTVDISYVYTENNKSYNVLEFADTVETKNIPLTAGLKNVKVTHSHGNDAPVEMTEASSETSGEDGQFFYNSTTGILTVWSSKYSEFKISYEYDFVAAIGTTGYSTLADAIENCADDDTIKLVKDCETGNHYGIPSEAKAAGLTDANPIVLDNDKVTLDLNGKTIIVTHNFSFVVAGNNVIVKNGIIKSKELIGENYRGYPLVVAATANAGSVTGVQVNDVTIYGGISAGGSIESNYTNIQGAGNVTLNNCTIKEGAAYTLYAQRNSTLNVVSGEYYKANWGLDSAESGSTISITGGNFNVEPLSTHVASGYVATVNGDNWTVNASN